MGEAVFWLKPLYQLGFVCFFDFYFWIRVEAFCSKLLMLYNPKVTKNLKDILNMTKNQPPPIITEIPVDEQEKFEKLIKSCRSKYIRTSQEIVDKVFKEKPVYLQNIKNKEVSQSILGLRGLVWNEYLKDEVSFNIILMQKMHTTLKTPQHILELLVNKKITELKEKDLLKEVRSLCGEYAGRVFPYIYKIALSNTNSRRSRAGKTFESIVYKVYDILEYDFDSQNKVGRKTFTKLGLGKKVDSILPSVDCYEQRRNKTIIGTMKTSLRERWQEVAEEIERTKIPEIHLLTVDEDISKSKAQEMANHNIIVVAYDWVANSESLTSMKNIISFEDYLFEEIPSILKFWGEK
ncbi:type II restriction endonuclease [Bathymodiolus azoricus thioautotrophic gill symbiont]|nr:type II restriction endonuclease [Bathymodiolus azoricus thioautotrophic gill symbiont]